MGCCLLTKKLLTGAVIDLGHETTNVSIFEEGIITNNNTLQILPENNENELTTPLIEKEDDKNENLISFGPGDTLGVKDNIIEKEEKKATSNAGFVSYILLGIITFIVSMGLLFAFIK